MTIKDYLLRETESFLSRHGLLRPGIGFVVATSGGADSLSLASVFWRLAAPYRLRVCVAHFEHGIRGDASVADARFVEGFCLERGIPFRLGSADVPAFAAKHNLSMETAARRERYSFLRRVKAELSLDYIAVAHHAGDQAETVLMHLLRGAGLGGLAAMRPVSGDVVRPFLSIPKATLVAYLGECGLTFRHDATNDVADGTRNRLRLELLPRLAREYNASLETALCQTADMAAAIADYLAAEAGRLWQTASRRIGRNVELNIPFLRRQPIAMQRELLRRLVMESRGSLQDISFGQLEDIRRLLFGDTGKSLSLPDGFLAVISYNWLKIIRLAHRDFSEVTLNFPGVTELSAYGLTVTAEIAETFPKKTAPNEFYGALEKLKLPLIVRTRRQGDRLQLAHGTVKLKDFFINAKIPRSERDATPLLSMGEGGGDVLWLMGLRRSVIAKPNESTTNYFYIKFSKKGDLYDD